jgi:hypothetical protein
MSARIKIYGNASYNLSGGIGTVTLAADRLENDGDSGSGTVRLELWLTATPWNPNGSNNGWEIATDQLGGSTNGTLAAGHYFSSVSNNVGLKNQPPAGTYFVTLVAATWPSTTAMSPTTRAASRRS